MKKTKRIREIAKKLGYSYSPASGQNNALIKGRHRNAGIKISVAESGFSGDYSSVYIRTSRRLPQQRYQLIIENGEVKGVMDHYGQKHMADVVVSTLDTHNTFLKLTDAEHLDSEYIESVKTWQWEC